MSTDLRLLSIENYYGIGNYDCCKAYFPSGVAIREESLALGLGEVGMVGGLETTDVGMFKVGARSALPEFLIASLDPPLLLLFLEFVL